MFVHPFHDELFQPKLEILADHPYIRLAMQRDMCIQLQCKWINDWAHERSHLLHDPGAGEECIVA